MAALSLARAKTILRAASQKGRELDLKPLSICILDAGGHVKLFERQDGSSNARFQIAFGKAHGALALGIGSRALMARAEAQPYFIASVTQAVGALVPVPGGVLIRSAKGEILGAVGVTGDTSDNDEAAAIAGIEAAKLTADPG